MQRYKNTVHTRSLLYRERQTAASVTSILLSQKEKFSDENSSIP